MRKILVTICIAACLNAQDGRLGVERYAIGVPNPVVITHAGDGSKRLFVVDQTGRIFFFLNGQVEPQPFLDIRSRVLFGGELGLLGLAFPPDFATSGLFYLNYTRDNPRRTVISRFRVSASNRNAADPASEEVLLEYNQPFNNHNGGHMEFSPRDGFLYITSGDGGSAGDPNNFAQSLDNLLGKLIRIDVRRAPGYVTPPSNPFLDRTGARPEIWARGLRNAWKFAFDRNGDMYIADVGQNAREELNFQPGSSPGGENYGWRFREGTICYNPTTNCPTSGLTDPIIDYSHASTGGSITGGRVYRGTRFPSARGTYFYADFNQQRFWGLRNVGGRWINRFHLQSDFFPSTFGEDEDGEVYVANYNSDGQFADIYRLVPDLRPEFAATGAVNGASFQAGLVPGSIASLFGHGITASNTLIVAAALPLPRSLEGVRVTLDGILCPLFALAGATAAEQINFQVPWELAGRSTARLEVSNNGVVSESVVVTLAARQPGIFEQTGRLAAAQRGDTNAAIGPNDSVRPGDVVVLYATGLGPVTRIPETGAANPAGATPVDAPVSATLGGLPAEVLYAGLTPGFAGLYQINLRIPDAANGTQPLVVTVGGAATQAGVLLRVQR